MEKQGTVQSEDRGPYLVTVLIDAIKELYGWVRRGNSEQGRFVVKEGNDEGDKKRGAAYLATQTFPCNRARLKAV